MNLISVNPRTSTCGSTAQAFTLPAADLQDLCNTPPIDIRRLLENCLGKRAFAVSLLEEFAKTATGRLEELAAQSQQGNLHTIADMVHGLRGVADILGAGALRESTADIEAACRNGDLVQTQRRIRQLCRDVQRIQQDIPNLCRTLLHATA